MCDVCSDVLGLLQTHDDRIRNHEGIQLSKDECLATVLYAQVWGNRQCMCCFRDTRNFERFNNIVQVMLSKAINFIQTLPKDCTDHKDVKHTIPKLVDKPEEIDVKEKPSEADQAAPDIEKKELDHGEDASNEKSNEPKSDPSKKENSNELKSEENESDANESWSLEEKDKLFTFATKVFLMNFPIYMAYKHTVHTTLDELSQQEAAALNNYCELNDVEVPVFLLRNVCFFCDSNGIHSIAQCFDKADPDILPYTVAHTLISLIANLRLWMNIGTVMQNIVPLRTYIIRYMCRLSDTDLRMAGTRSMTDLMWAAVKEPVETHMTFDKEGLDLALKYFVCSTLTMRLAGITQITNQINIYNDMANNESIMESDPIGHDLANWLIENKIVEHLFGPNLHVEIIKQSQVLLNFLAMECRLTNEHIKVMWAASQLKHCGRPVQDVLAALIKHLAVKPVQHLLRLVTALEPAAHTEQTLYIAGALIKYLWNAATQHQVDTLAAAAAHQHHLKAAEMMDSGGMKRVRRQRVSVGGSDDDGSDDGFLEEGEIRLGRRHIAKHHQHLHHRGGHHHRMDDDDDEDEEDEEEDVSVEDDDEEEEEEDSSLCEGGGGNSDLSESDIPALARARAAAGGCQCHGHVTGVIPRHVRHRRVSEGSESEEEGEVPPPDSPAVVTQRRNVARRGRLRGSWGRGGGAMRVPAAPTAPTAGNSKDRSFNSEEADAEDDSGGEDRNVGAEPKAKRSKGSEEEESGKSSEDEGKEGKKEEEEAGVQASPVGKTIKGVKPGPLSRKLAVNKRELYSHKDYLMAKQQQQELENLEVVAYQQNLLRKRQMKMTKDGKVTKDSAQDGESGCESDHGAEMYEKYMANLDYARKNLSPDDLNTYLEHLHQSAQKVNRAAGGSSAALAAAAAGDFIEDILSPEDDPEEDDEDEDEEDGHSSGSVGRVSNKSEKNMADFEGEDELLLSDEDLAGLTTAAAVGGTRRSAFRQPGGGGGMQQTLAHMASLYRSKAAAIPGHRGTNQLSPGSANGAGPSQEDFVKTFRFEDVTKPGNTLLWDLIQDHTISKLPEGLACDAEKALTTLVCFSTDKRIRCQFIEACVKNIQQHKSVVVSLRLLPKLFASFQQFRGSGLDTHTVTVWASNDLEVMKHFFNNLEHYTDAYRANNREQLHPLFSHREEVSVRLSFLAAVFSNAGSPDSLTLSVSQIDTLWRCLALDPGGDVADDALSWLLNQAKSKDHHALGLDSFKHIFLEKMPQVAPERMSMVGLSLFTSLCSLARIANAALAEPLPDEHIAGMRQLWGIALRAANTDVSLTAIHYLNSYYINHGNGELEKEEEFVQRCMDNLVTASTDIDEHPEASLLVIQRGLVLLTNHLEGFRKRYAFHLRQWQLEGRGVTSHQKSLADQQSQPLRIVLQPAGSSDKMTLEMYSSDLIAELRAEVTQWWEAIQRQHRIRQKQYEQDQLKGGSGSISSGSVLTPILGAMLGEGPIRMITLGQELTVDMDEKTLGEIPFKDGQMVFVSISAGRNLRKADGAMPAAYLPPPPRDKMPQTLLIQEPYAEQLFGLLQQLSDFRPDAAATDKQTQCSLHTKAKVLSRKVWDLLMILPSNPNILQGFKALVSGDDGSPNSAGPSGDTLPPSQGPMDWPQLLDYQSPHKLMYSLQIVESLSRPPKHRRKSVVLSSRGDSRMASTESDANGSEDTELPEEVWSRRFIQKDGLKHLFSIFLSGRLQTKYEDQWNEWQQDCLAYLLRLVSQFSVIRSDMDGQDDVFHLQADSPRKKMKKLKANERVFIPRLNKTILAAMVEVSSVVEILATILYDAALPGASGGSDSAGAPGGSGGEPWLTAAQSWGRVEVMHYALAFLVSFSFSSDQVQPALTGRPDFAGWLKRLIMEAPEPRMRQETCQGLYKLCLGKTADGQTGYKFLMPVLSNLLTFLDDAQSMKPAKKRCQEEKEPFGPGCRDYFWLLCRLVESVTQPDAIASWTDESSAFNLHILGQHVAASLRARPFLEQRHQLQEDDGLIGLLQLAASIMKHNPPFKASAEGREFLLEVFGFLFALPSPARRFLPKCKSQTARSAAYDLMVEMVVSCPDNYTTLHDRVMKQHYKDSHAAYTWDNWPHEEERAKCGYVGLTNLGATCYMATCMQHLYMIPEARRSVLEATCTTPAGQKHAHTLSELKRMFAYLLESERKAYNPRNFCKAYTMDHQPLNTGEQKDMTEFFTDLITKLEEMGPELKVLVKGLFGGVLTNNVVSLDCSHVSRTKEEFYTVRCQVADMKNLYESLDEVTVKDMLEGDNMYTCSKCQKKVRAEKRACFKTLPKILCFNTMRYTFNMITMMKEKVNTHFSFPLRLDMSPYMETNLIKRERLKADESGDCDSSEDEDETPGGGSGGGAPCGGGLVQDEEKVFEYELTGVTVHTGTAEGGHYYSFIRDRVHKAESGQDKWYLFNDAEVKPFDPAQIATECFGGEMTSKTYDSVSDKFMDFSFEKTNSAYMLFYERIAPGAAGTAGSDAGSSSEQVAASRKSETIVRPPAAHRESTSKDEDPGAGEGEGGSAEREVKTAAGEEKGPESEQETEASRVTLSKDLADWIWQDNMQFLQDKNIFEHTYFGFIWQMCSYIPSTLSRGPAAVAAAGGPAGREGSPNVPLLAAKLSSSFLLETYIHAKEKPNMVQWIESLTKQFNNCHAACEWFLDLMAEDDWWPQQILIKCPNQVVRQMFQRLLIHVIKALRPTHAPLYLADLEEVDSPDVGNKSCVTRFVKKMLTIIRHGNKPHCKYLTEYFAFLHEFGKMGDNECLFLLQVNAIATMVTFFMSHKTNDAYVEIVSDDDEDEDEDVVSAAAAAALPDDKYRPASLDKMIALVAMLVEKSRGAGDGGDHTLHLAPRDFNAIVSGKGFPFLYNQIRDSINLRQSANLIFSLSRWNERLAMAIINMIFSAISRLGQESAPFFKVLSMLVEFVGGPPGLPSFIHYILQKFWEVAEFCPQQCLEWLAHQVPRNKVAHHWTLQNLDMWVEPFLLAHQNLRVRNTTALLLVALVPSTHFRQAFRSSAGRGGAVLSPPGARGSGGETITLSAEATNIMHQVYQHLLRLLGRARQYVDVHTHGTGKLVPYFAVLSHCLVSRTEKIMFSRYFVELWQLFQPRLSEPAIAMHHNKQALLMFWHQVCTDCPENVKLIVSNAHVTKNIAFNYILADHEDQEVVVFNRAMLPAYYGILRMACLQSRPFTRQLAQHQNIQWAFKNITPFPTQYTAAVDELFKMMQLMVARYTDTTEDELKAIAKFKRDNILLYLQAIEARTSWQTLIMALKLVVVSPEDRLLVLQQGGLGMLYEAYSTLHVMHHEATACHVAADIVDLLQLVTHILRAARNLTTGAPADKKGLEIKQHLPLWGETSDFAHKLLGLLNSYQPPEIRQAALDALRELALTYQIDCVQSIVPILLQGHSQFQDQNLPIPTGPYFPKRGQKAPGHKSSIRCPRPQFQMFLQSNMLEASRGVDEAYDTALHEYFLPYHTFVDLLVRVAVNNKHVSEALVTLSAMVAFEGAPLHTQHFAKLWYEIYQTLPALAEHGAGDSKWVVMLVNSSSLIDYMDAVLEDERGSLNLQHIYQFFINYFPKVWQQILNDQGHALYENIMTNIIQTKQALEVQGLTERDLHKLMNRINGDVRALLLIFSVQPPGPLPALLDESLRSVQTFCRKLQEQRLEAQRLREEQLRRQQDQEEQEEPVPRKRRRTSEGRTSDGSEEKGDSQQDEKQPNTKLTESAAETVNEAAKSNQKAQNDTNDKNDNDDEKDNKDDTKMDTTEKGDKLADDKKCDSENAGTSGDDAQASTSAQANEKEAKSKMKNTPTVSGKDRKAPQREKTTIVDMVIKNIESIFTMLLDKK